MSYGIPLTFDGVIERQADGSERHYTAEQWAQKQIMDKLEAIEARLAKLEIIVQHLCPDRSSDI